jgi:hypothetical protein
MGILCFRQSYVQAGLTILGAEVVEEQDVFSWGVYLFNPVSIDDQPLNCFCSDFF